MIGYTSSGGDRMAVGGGEGYVPPPLPHHEGGGGAQVVDERGHGRGGGPLVRGEPGGGEQGPRAHHGGAGQTVEELPPVDQPAGTHAEGNGHVGDISTQGTHVHPRSECTIFFHGAFQSIHNQDSSRVP